DTSFCRSYAHKSVAGRVDLDVIACSAHHAATNRLGKLTKLCQSDARLLGINELHAYGIRCLAERGVSDLRITQLLADIAAQTVEPVLAQLLRVHLQKQIGATAQIEAKAQLLF